MKTTLAIVNTALLASLLGCASQGGTDTAMVEGSEPAHAAEATPSIPLQVEQAERRLDVGRDAAGAKQALVAILADPAATSEERDQATFALSRANEATGDLEGAIASLEKLLAAHADDDRWSLQEAVEARLRKMLTGDESEKKGPRFDEEAVAPFAKVLAAYYKPDERGSYTANTHMFGARAGVADRLGTFNIGGALRETRREKCPLCDDSRVFRDISRHGGWVAIPAVRAKLGDALNVFYFDLERRIPARYEELLPMKTAEIVARLDKGEGVVAARERPDAPPVLLIAAPRAAQLAAVEEYLSTLTSLPKEPVSVQVPASLQREEIQTVMRGGRRAHVKCYEALLARDPEAEGNLVMDFAILGDGSVADFDSKGTTPAMRDADFGRCMADATRGLAFGKTGKKTTVSYPFAFSPGSQPPAK